LFQERGDGTSYLCHFERVCEPGTVKIEFAREKDLGLGLEPAKRRAINDSVPVGLKRRTIVVRLSWSHRLEIEPVVELIFYQAPHSQTT
jgi:hypothetical protein